MSADNGFTHRVRLWIDNDYGLYTEVHSLARQASEGGENDLADAIRALIEPEELPVQGALADLLSLALVTVQWDELARDYMEEEREAMVLEEAEDA
jgi:hypothetical protein